MNVPFISEKTIRWHVAELLRAYRRSLGTRLSFPLDPADLYGRMFELCVGGDYDGAINRTYGEGVYGCLFPDGHDSPWGPDKIIAINRTPTAGFDPTTRSEYFTAHHEGAGHYLLHFLEGYWEHPLPQQPAISRTAQQTRMRKPRAEWQADHAAGEAMMPYRYLVRVLDGRKPPAVIDLERDEERLVEHFGVSPVIAETRLAAVGYGLRNGQCEWAKSLPPRGKGQPRGGPSPQERMKRLIADLSAGFAIPEEWNHLQAYDLE